jgi:hypothetical protein
VANFPLATYEFYRNREGEEVSKTEWQRIVGVSGTFISKTILKRKLNSVHSSSGTQISKIIEYLIPIVKWESQFAYRPSLFPGVSMPTEPGAAYTMQTSCHYIRRLVFKKI